MSEVKENAIKKLKEALEEVKDLEPDDSIGKTDKGEVIFVIDYAIAILECGL